MLCSPLRGLPAAQPSPTAHLKGSGGRTPPILLPREARMATSTSSTERQEFPSPALIRRAGCDDQEALVVTLHYSCSPEPQAELGTAQPCFARHQQGKELRLKSKQSLLIPTRLYPCLT